MLEKQEKIAEVIAAETSTFTAQSYELYELPPLGSLVKTGNTYAVVCHAETAGLDTGRKPVARGRDEVSEEAYTTLLPSLPSCFVVPLRRRRWAIGRGTKSTSTSRPGLPNSTALSICARRKRLKSSGRV